MSRLKAAYHHGDLRAVVLNEVRGIIREQGVGLVSIREVARRANVSHAAPAHHFGNKSGLLTAFAVEGFDRLADLTHEALAASGATTPPEILAVMGQAYVRFAIDFPEHFAVMYPGDQLNVRDPEYRRASDRCYGPLVAIVRRAAQEGYLTADERVVAAAAWSIVHGMAALWLSGRMQPRVGPVDPGVLAKGITELFVSRVMRREPET